MINRNSTKMKFGIAFIVVAVLFIARCGMGVEKKKTNLLFIMTDQQRYDALSIAGNTVLILRRTISYAPTQILWCEFLPDYPRRAEHW